MYPLCYRGVRIGRRGDDKGIIVAGHQVASAGMGLELWREASPVQVKKMLCRTGPGGKSILS